MDTPNIDWQALRAPFEPRDVDFRIQRTFERDGKPQAAVVAYMDARLVQDRLDTVVGPQHWSFAWEPLSSNAAGEITVAKGTLTICGVSKSDVGDAGKTEPSKASVSDALKRAAVMWGIGRYLYALPVMFAAVEKRGNQEQLAKGEVERLRAALPKPNGAPSAQPAAVEPPVEYGSAKITSDVIGKLKGLAAKQGVTWADVLTFIPDAFAGRPLAELTVAEGRSLWTILHDTPEAITAAQAEPVEHDLRELGTLARH